MIDLPVFYAIKYNPASSWNRGRFFLFSDGRDGGGNFFPNAMDITFVAFCLFTSLF